MRPRLITARAILVDSEHWLDGGGVLIEHGRIARVLTSRRAVHRAARDARVTDLGATVLAPGWVNAHAHLELGALAGRTQRGADFAAWVRCVIALRARCSARELAAGVHSGAERCLTTGTTSVADVDSSGACERAPPRDGPRVWLYREALDAQDPRRTGAALARIRAPLGRQRLLREALSPHSPFTVSPRLFAELGRIARRRRLPVSIHWSETREEVAWLRDGSGPLAALLGASPRSTGLELISAAGMLRAPLSLVHGNYPARGEARCIAQAGAVVVHCPGSHAWFEREPFRLRHYLSNGVTLALGTDSLASNDDLDLRREMQRLRAQAPSLSPAQVWRMATVNGALALGARGQIGELVPGARADLVAHACRARSLGAALDELTGAEVAIAEVWLGGRRVRAAAPDANRARSSSVPCTAGDSAVRSRATATGESPPQGLAL